MNPATNTKVVSINAAGRERGPGLRVVNDCRERLGETLCRWLGGIRAPISEELFLLADGTRERLLQTRYLDLRQDIEKDWSQFVEAFRHSLADADIPQPTGGTLDVPDFEGLQLVEDEELSERIVVREFAAQLAESCDEELYSLDRRIAALLGHDEPQDGANLLAPIYICQALADAAAALGLDAESRLLLMRRIERHLHLALPSIYHDINAELIERNILPDLKRSYKRGGAGASTSPRVGANAIDAALQAAAGNLTAPAGDILGAMERLVAARTQSLGANSGTQQASAASPAASNAAAISHAFLTSLNEAQHTEWVPTAGVLQNQVRAVRESDVAQQVSPVEAVTIDIVAMLFDFIFNDEELPATVKSLVGQLQIPVLKVAMLDHSFFANRQHPARRFLDGITGVALHWGAGAREGDPFLNRLELLVTRIQQEFETNIEIFGEAIADLENFVTAHEAEEAATVEIAADAVIRREAEEAAAERTQGALAPILARPQPEVVRNFLAEHWAAVLRQKALQTEADSAGWQDTVEVAEQLVWSVEPKSEADERLRLISSLPMLLARINAGLAMIAIDGSARGNFFDALVGLHAGALKGHVLETPPQEVAAPKDETPALSEGDLLVTRRIEEGVVIEDVMLVGAPPMRRARDREALDQVRNLKRGDWVDFIDEEGNAARERLNWVSPQKGILVFSNHRAARAISISPDALARQIRDGAARVVADTSVFDKAIDGVMRSLNAA